VKENKLDCLSHVQGSSEFKADLSMQQYQWIYTPDEAARRVLLLQYKDPSSDSDHEKAKSMRKLGALACTQLQGKKADDVQIYTSEGIESEHLGVFYNSFYLSNFEWSMKSNLEEPKKDSEEKEEEKDPRLEKKNKQISEWAISSEKGEYESLESFKF
jgi:hypothetical protein